MKSFWARFTKALADHWFLFVLLYLVGPLLTILIEWIILHVG